jgi:Zn-dependent protease
MDLIYTVSIWLLPVLIAITFHEAAHGYVARFLGDDTASRLGRVSLNPLRHIDPFGTILLPGILLLARSPFYLDTPSQCQLIFVHFETLVLAWCLSQRPGLQ